MNTAIGSILIEGACDAESASQRVLYLCPHPFNQSLEALARLNYRPKTHLSQLPVVFVDDVDQAMAEYVTLVNRPKTEDMQTRRELHCASLPAIA